MGRKITQEQCLERFRRVHGDKYDYQFVVYTRQSDKVKIGCKKCRQFFMQSPEKHWIGQGCGSCKGLSISESKMIDKDEFLRRCVSKGFDWFDTSNFSYVSSKDKTLFACLECGHENMMKPNNVMSGKGCSMCARRNFGGYAVDALLRLENKTKASKPCTLYHVKIFLDGEYICDKIGVTTTGLDLRFKPFLLSGYDYKVVRTTEDTLINCVFIELMIKETIKINGCNLQSNPFKGFANGWTECFLPVCYNKA